MDYIKHGMSLGEAECRIQGAMESAVGAYVEAGYYLKAIRDQRLYTEAGYGSFESYVRDRYDRGRDWASRCIKVNDELSEGGNSARLDSRYQGYSTHKLIELASMTGEQRDQASPDMTVRKLRELRQPDVREPEHGIPGQIGIEDFLGETPEELDGQQVPAGENAAAEKPETDVVMSQQSEEGPERQEPAGEDMVAGDWAERALDYQAAERGEDEPGIEGEAEIVVTSQQNGEEQLSAYGTPRKVYPEDSLIAIRGCEGRHSCRRCAMDCNIRQEERWCREAPCGSPFPCETMFGLHDLVEGPGEQCQFINHGLAWHWDGDHESDPCCKDCQDPCEYICERARRNMGQQESKTGQDEPGPGGAAEVVATSQQNREEPDGQQESDEQLLRRMLEKEKDFLEQMIKVDKVDPLPADLVRKKKLLVGALAGMLCDMEAMKDEEAEETTETAQPELPLMKNNGQRKAWLRDYQSWGLWYEDGHIGARYYKYDFDNGARLIAEEYIDHNKFTGQDYTSSYLHLVSGPEPPTHPLYGDGRWSRHETYSRFPDSETELVEFLKFAQKGKDNGKIDRK